MKSNSYTKNSQPRLYVVATPIGNLSEMSPRALDTLQKVKTILCEDTRVSSKLLSHFNIKEKNLISYHKENEYDKKDRIIDIIKEEHEVVLISDAGYPLLSDPGSILVKELINLNINIIVINGSNALLPSLINSGFDMTPFTFIGFLNHKASESKNQLEGFSNYNHTLVLYESVHRIKQTLNNILNVFGDVPLAISREITKLNEEIIRGKVSSLINEIDTLKGELVIVIDNSSSLKQEVISDVVILDRVKLYISSNISKKDSIKRVSKELGIEKNYVYNLVHENKGDNL